MKRLEEMTTELERIHQIQVEELRKSYDGTCAYVCSYACCLFEICMY